VISINLGISKLLFCIKSTATTVVILCFIDFDNPACYHFKNYCAPGIEASPFQAIIAPAALVGSSDIRGSHFSARPLWFTHTDDESRNVSAVELYTFICQPGAGPTVHQDRLLQACFPVKVIGSNSSDQRFCDILKSRLRFCSIKPAASASEVIHETDAKPTFIFIACKHVLTCVG